MKLRQLELYYAESLLLAGISFLVLALINEIGSIACGGRSFDLFVSFQHLRSLAPEESWPAFCVLSGLFLKLWLLLFCNTFLPGSLLLWGLFIGFDNLPLPVYFLIVASLIQIVFYARKELRLKPRLLLANAQSQNTIRFCTLSFLFTYFWLSFGQIEFTCLRQAALLPLVEKCCGRSVAARFLIGGLPSLRQEKGPFSFGRTSLNLAQASEESQLYFRAVEYSRRVFGEECPEQVQPALALSYLNDKTQDKRYWQSVQQALLQAKLSVSELEVLFRNTFGYANAYDYLASKALRLQDYDLADAILSQGIQAIENDSASGVKPLLFSLYATHLQVAESRGACVRARLQLVRASLSDLKKKILALQKSNIHSSTDGAVRELQEGLAYFQARERELSLSSK